MDQEELERLAGKQALLQRDRRALASTFSAEKQKIIGVANMANSGPSKEWLDSGVALLNHVYELHLRLQELDRQIAEYRKRTGLE